MSKQPFYIPSLDGLRAVAILIVFFSHAGLENWVPGGFGVTIFFFLSGFLITTLLRRELAKTGTIHLKQFYIRRMLRIWPAFYVVLGAGALLTMMGWLPGAIRAVPLLSQVLHFANYFSILYGNDGMTLGTGVYWSLAVEEHFYLMFPFLYLALVKAGMKPRGQLAVFAALCAMVLLWRCLLIFHFGVDEHRTFYASDTRVDSILFGCILAVWGNPMLDPWAGSERLWKFGLFPAGLALIGGTLLYRSFEFRETLRYTLQGIALVPVFVTAIRYPVWWPFRLLNTRVAKFFGLISYPLYLVHFTIILALRNGPMPPLVQGGIAFLLSLILAYGIYRFIEQPIARIRKKHQVA